MESSAPSIIFVPQYWLRAKGSKYGILFMPHQKYSMTDDHPIYQNIERTWIMKYLHSFKLNYGINKHLLFELSNMKLLATKFLHKPSIKNSSVPQENVENINECNCLIYHIQYKVVRGSWLNVMVEDSLNLLTCFTQNHNLINGCISLKETKMKEKLCPSSWWRCTENNYWHKQLLQV